MFNRSFFLGALTTLVVVFVLAVCGLVAVQVFRPTIGAGFIAGGRPGVFERRGGDQQLQPQTPGNQRTPERGDNRFDHRDGRDFNYYQGRPSRPRVVFFLRGIAGVLGCLVLSGLIVAAIVGGVLLFRRTQSRPTPAAAPEEPPARTPVTDEASAEPPVESAADLPEEPAEPNESSEPPVEPPADENR